jgi:hypothetical protein
VLPGYIQSVEDHGCIVAFGIDSLTGFVKQADLGMDTVCRELIASLAAAQGLGLG